MTRLAALAALLLWPAQDADLEKVLTTHKDVWFSLRKKDKKVGYIRLTSAKETLDGQAVWRFRDTYKMILTEGTGTIVQETVVKQNAELDLVSATQTFTILPSEKMREKGLGEKVVIEASAKPADGRIQLTLLKTEGVPESGDSLSVEELRKSFDQTVELHERTYVGGAFVRKLWMTPLADEETSGNEWTWVLPAEDDPVKRGPVRMEGKDEEGRFLVKSRVIRFALKADRTIAALEFWGAQGTPSDEKSATALD